MQNLFFTKETWEFINTFAPWFSAFGTILAVIVSLYLATREKRIKLKITVGHRLFIQPMMQGNFPEFLYINIVNIGFREVKITNIGWKVGLFKKQYAVQSIISNDGISSPFPVKLKDGEEAKYFIPLNEQTNWINNFVNELLKPNIKSRLRHTRIQIFTSVGKIFESKIDKGLKNKILKSIEN